jgi:hypothetical protein
MLIRTKRPIVDPVRLRYCLHFFIPGTSVVILMHRNRRKENGPDGPRMVNARRFEACSKTLENPDQADALMVQAVLR